MRRLYLQIYAALLAIVVLFGVVAAGAWVIAGRAGHDVHLLRGLAAMASDLLLALAESAGRVLSRETLMQRVRGEGLDAFDRSIDVHVSRIRAAIEDDPRRPRRILTVRGAGYVFARRQDQDA